MILIPGDLIILQKEIPGFNNILTVADEKMKFGLNEDVNKKVVTYVATPKIKHDAVNSPGTPVSNTIVGNRNNNRTERDSSQSYRQRNYERTLPRVMSTPTMTLTSVALGASTLSFVAAMAIRGIF